jgi:WD40 repeat protein
MLLRTLSLVAALVLLGRTGAQTGSSSPVKEHLVLKEGSGSVWSLSFHRDSRTLAAALEDKTVRVYDVAANRELAVLKEHADAVRAVAFAPDGKLLASGSKDGTVKLWSWDGQAKLVATLEGHKSWVLSLAFSPDGKLLASGGKVGASAPFPSPTKTTAIVSRLSTKIMSRWPLCLSTSIVDGIESAGFHGLGGDVFNGVSASRRRYCQYVRTRQEGDFVSSMFLRALTRCCLASSPFPSWW